MSIEHLYKERVESTLKQVKFANGGADIGVNRYDLELYVKEFKRIEADREKRIKSESKAHMRRLSSEGLADELYSALFNIMKTNNVESDEALQAIGSYKLYN